MEPVESFHFPDDTSLDHSYLDITPAHKLLNPGLSSLITSAPFPSHSDTSVDPPPLVPRTDDFSLDDESTVLVSEPTWHDAAAPTDIINPYMTLAIPDGVEVGPTECYVLAKVSLRSRPEGRVIPHLVEGAIHPYLRGWVGTDQSRCKSHRSCYALKGGFGPGIHQTWPGVWARHVGFRAVHGKTAPAPKPLGAHSRSEAIRFLHFDPATPDGRRQIADHTRRWPPVPICVPYAMGPSAAYQARHTPLPPPANPGFQVDIPSEIVTPASPPGFPPQPPAPDASAHDTASTALSTNPSLAADPSAPGTVDSSLPPPSLALSTTGSIFTEIQQWLATQQPAAPTSSPTESQSAKLRREQRQFPSYPKGGNFKGPKGDQFLSQLQTTLSQQHWRISDGRSSYDVASCPPNDADQNISMVLDYHLTTSIQAANCPVALGILTKLRTTTSNAALGFEIVAALRAHRTTSGHLGFLQEFTAWESISHLDNEAIMTLYKRMEEAKSRLVHHGYPVSAMTFKMKFFSAVLHGPYRTNLLSLRTEFEHSRIDIHTTEPIDLAILVERFFSNHCLDRNGDIVPAPKGGSPHPGPQVVGSGRRVDGGTPPPTTPPDSSDNLTPQAVIAHHKKYKCIACKLLRRNRGGEHGGHITSACPHLLFCGYTVNYAFEKDQAFNPTGRPSAPPGAPGAAARLVRTPRRDALPAPPAAVLPVPPPGPLAEVPTPPGKLSQAPPSPNPPLGLLTPSHSPLPVSPQLVMDKR
jgi:hypothetical protein